MSKKIAIVADIHANKYALDKFLQYINHEKIDTIINLGDFVQIGPNPYEVSKVVLNDDRFINILGNNEASLLEIDYKQKNDENEHRIWTKRQMKENFIKIQKIPLERVVTIEGINILMVHSRKNNIKGMPLIYSGNIDDFTNDYKEYKVDIVLFGHTHEKLYIEHNNRFFINPGSLGCSKKSTVDFTIVEISNKTLKNCIFKSLEYNKFNLIKDYNNNSVPDKEFLMKTFYKINC